MISAENRGYGLDDRGSDSRRGSNESEHSAVSTTAGNTRNILRSLIGYRNSLFS
jgi:hypothetical protein